jgi:hypothetical protein
MYRSRSADTAFDTGEVPDMAEERPPTDPNTGDAHAAPDRRRSAPGTPRWVWALGLVAVLLIVIVIAGQLLFGVQHGPGIHGPSGTIAVG